MVLWSLIGGFVILLVALFLAVTSEEDSSEEKYSKKATNKFSENEKVHIYKIVKENGEIEYLHSTETFEEVSKKLNKSEKIYTS